MNDTRQHRLVGQPLFKSPNSRQVEVSFRNSQIDSLGLSQRIAGCDLRFFTNLVKVPGPNQPPILECDQNFSFLAI